MVAALNQTVASCNYFWRAIQPGRSALVIRAMLRCARCTFPMTVMEHQGAHADWCRRCGGVYLERGEAALAMSPEADPENWVRSKIAAPLGPSKLRCPKDHS